MTVALTCLLTGDEFHARDKAARARGLWSCDPHEFPPGSAWLMPWYYDPKLAEDDPRQSERRARGLEGLSFLSVAYWRDHSEHRSPITMVCPNGEQWCVDQKANNGPGWTVTGDWPRITARPSIVVPGYHGWLTDGVFSTDLDGRSPNGVARPYTPRSAA